MLADYSEQKRVLTERTKENRWSAVKHIMTMNSSYGDEYQVIPVSLVTTKNRPGFDGTRYRAYTLGASHWWDRWMWAERLQTTDLPSFNDPNLEAVLLTHAKQYAGRLHASSDTQGPGFPTSPTSVFLYQRTIYLRFSFRQCQDRHRHRVNMGILIRQLTKERIYVGR